MTENKRMFLEKIGEVEKLNLASSLFEDLGTTILQKQQMVTKPKLRYLITREIMKIEEIINKILKTQYGAQNQMSRFQITN